MKVKWGVIGAGGIADRRTLPGMMLARNAELVGVMEVNMALAEKLKQKYGAKAAYDNEDDLLANKDIQAVYIASPVIFHKEQAIKAAKAKKHILLEKPLALTSKDAQEIVGVCKEEGVLLAAGFMMRYHGYHQKMKEIITSGQLGQIVSCRAQLTCWYPDIPGAWRQVKALSGGGALVDLGVHCIDVLQYLTDAKVKKVAAFTGTNTFRYEVDDSASVIMQLSNGAYAYVDAFMNIPDAAAECRLEIYGTKGGLMAKGTLGQVEGGEAYWIQSDSDLAYDAAQNRQQDKVCQLEAKLGNMYTKEIESFGESILNGKPVSVPGEDAVYVQRVVEQAYLSSETEKFCTL